MTGIDQSHGFTISGYINRLSEHLSKGILSYALFLFNNASHSDQLSTKLRARLKVALTQNSQPISDSIIHFFKSPSRSTFTSYSANIEELASSNFISTHSHFVLTLTTQHDRGFLVAFSKYRKVHSNLKDTLLCMDWIKLTFLAGCGLVSFRSRSCLQKCKISPGTEINGYGKSSQMTILHASCLVGAKKTVSRATGSVGAKEGILPAPYLLGAKETVLLATGLGGAKGVDLPVPDGVPLALYLDGANEGRLGVKMPAVHRFHTLRHNDTRECCFETELRSNSQLKFGDCNQEKCVLRGTVSLFSADVQMHQNQQVEFEECNREECVQEEAIRWSWAEFWASMTVIEGAAALAEGKENREEDSAIFVDEGEKPAPPLLVLNLLAGKASEYWTLHGSGADSRDGGTNKTNLESTDIKNGISSYHKYARLTVPAIKSVGGRND
jgi:hypothetical protein